MRPAWNGPRSLTRTTTSRPFTCQSCHTHAEDVTATAHASITGYRYDSNGCFGCHPGGGEAPIAASDHSSRVFPIQSGSHQNLSCAGCHTDSTSSKVFVCTTCHTQSQSAGQHKEVSGYTWTEAACYGCHPQDQ